MIVVTSLKDNKSTTYDSTDIEDCLIRGHIHLNSEITVSGGTYEMLKSLIFNTPWHSTLFQTVAIDTNKYTNEV